MIDKQLIEKKLRCIEKLLRELVSVKVETMERFKERNIELAVEHMVDILNTLIPYKESGSKRTRYIFRMLRYFY